MEIFKIFINEIRLNFKNEEKQLEKILYYPLFDGVVVDEIISIHLTPDWVA